MRKIKFRKALARALIIYCLGDYPNSDYIGLMDELTVETNDAEWAALKAYFKLADEIKADKEREEGKARNYGSTGMRKPPLSG